jgi:Spy/CpxP family protein refolding chaperone
MGRHRFIYMGEVSPSMKNIVKFITFGAICAGLAIAQHTPPDPATIAQRQVERLTHMLNLTSDQQTQATTIFTNAQTANQSVMTNLQQARTSLASAIKSNDANSIATLSSQIGTLTGQMTANSAKADAAFYAILTSDQQSKYNPMGGFGGGFGRGFSGPGGPHGRGGPRQ